MGKRKHGKHDGQFQPGNTPWNKGGTRKTPEKPSKYVRATEEDFRLLADKDRKGNIQHDKKRIIAEARRPCLLRPQKSATSEMAQYLVGGTGEDADDVAGYRIWKVTAGVEGIAKAQQEHDTKHPTCRRRVRASAKGELQVGLATSETLVCDYCGYTSSRMKFYDEIEREGRGGRTPVINMAAQVALADCPMAVSAFRQMMASMDLPVPCESSLQNLANRYSDIIEEENAEDMERWIDAVQRVNTMKGNKAGTAVRVQTDTIYQTPIGRLRGRKPGQASSHSNAICVEEVTTRKKVIANHIRNKNCGMCKFWKSYNLEAPDHKCTANISQQAVIGNEEEAGEAMAKTLLKKGVRVGGHVGDGDGHTYRGMEKVMREEAGQRTKQERCYVHLSRGIAKKVSNTAFSKNMFPGKTANLRNSVKSRFGDDLAQRLNAEHHAAMERMGMRDKLGMERAMRKAMEAIPSCYAGDHSECHQKSQVCRHPSVWKFEKMSEKTRGLLRPDRSDCKVLGDIMKKRLGPDALEKTRHAAETNKAESVNRQITKSNPKNITRFRTLAGRIASALHASNNGTGLSVAMKRLAAGIPLSKRSKAVKALEGMRKRQDYKRAYKQESANKKREKANIMKKFQQYDESREEGTYRSEKVEEELSKGVRKSPRKKPRPDYRQDHVYSQPGDAEPEDDYTGSESEEEDVVYS
ncbi:lens induction in camera-type eye [Branchiostoma belcheri]|nr:lens induction in camera-type eye [Branchiostoma belcheri]KAI8491020.1 lens induction in camera-type eye [Branchiostoma belcheri]